jgi:hypothetical protein
MKNTYAVFVAGTEYTCTQFFDTDKGDGIDIKDAMTGKYVGQVLGEVIPEIDDAVEAFEERVTAFIEENL